METGVRVLGKGSDNKAKVIAIGLIAALLIVIFVIIFRKGKRLSGRPKIQREQLYKVVKIFRVSHRREIIKRHLTRDEAKSLVNRYPDSSRSMVVFMKESPFVE